MIIAHEKDAPTVEIPEPLKRSLKVLLSPILHKGLDSIASGLTILPPSGKSDEAEHIEGEMFYVISGRGLIRVGDEESELTTGTAVWVPPNIFHCLINNSNANLKVLWVLSPPGRESEIIDKAANK